MHVIWNVQKNLTEMIFGYKLTDKKQWRFEVSSERLFIFEEVDRGKRQDT